MDPVTQTLAQQQSGSAGGQGFAQFYTQGQQHGLARRHLDLAERQEQRLRTRQSALLPLEQEALRLNNANTGIEAILNLQKFRVQEQQNAALPALMNLQMRFSQSELGYNDPALLQEAMDMSQQYPQAFAQGPGAQIIQGMEGSLAFKQRFLRYMEMDQKLMQQGQRLQGYQVNPSGGFSIQTEVPGPAVQSTTDIRNQQFEDQLRAQISATPPGPARTTLEERLATFQARSMPSGTSTEVFDPTTGNVIMRNATGRAATTQSGLPTSTIADVERKAAAAEDAVSFAMDVIKYAETRNVGVLGNINRLGTEWLGQVMNVKPGDEFKYAQAAAALRAAAVKVLRSDSNITETERRALESNMPSTKPGESDESAKEKAKNIAHILSSSARRQLLRANRPIPPALWTGEDIEARVASGQLTAEEAARLWSNSPLNYP